MNHFKNIPVTLKPYDKWEWVSSCIKPSATHTVWAFLAFKLSISKWLAVSQTWYGVESFEVSVLVYKCILTVLGFNFVPQSVETFLDLFLSWISELHWGQQLFSSGHIWAKLHLYRFSHGFWHLLFNLSSLAWFWKLTRLCSTWGFAADYKPQMQLTGRIEGSIVLCWLASQNRNKKTLFESKLTTGVSDSVRGYFSVVFVWPCDGWLICLEHILPFLPMTTGRGSSPLCDPEHDEVGIENGELQEDQIRVSLCSAVSILCCGNDERLMLVLCSLSPHTYTHPYLCF